MREFDRTGKLPTYMILVDLNYWEGNRGRLYTDVLQDPLGARPRLPRQDDAQSRRMQAGIEEAQRKLREAVAASKGLQAEAARRGPSWLRDYVSVHLSVMNPADFSYRTRHLVGYLPIAPDTMVRDHRKIAFHDLSELDPEKGEALFGGVGVGEQYTTATWEDRAVRLRGPAAVTLKEAARRYLAANGFTDRDMPLPLRALPKPPDYAERVRALEARGWTATAMQVHNEIGFAPKSATVASAVLYTLMPSGSLIVVPDSIWTHELWAAHLVGAALRGCHVYVIAPAAANAPSAGFPQLSRTREIFSRFLEIQNLLGPEIEARGGRLRTGLYTRRAGVDDVKAKLVEMHETFERYPFLKEDFPFPAEFYAAFADAEARLDAAGYTPDARLPEDARARAPKLHRKTQLFATREALSALVRDRRVQDVIANQVTFAVREGAVYDREGLANADVDFRPLFAPYLDAFRDLPRGGPRAGRALHDRGLAQQGRARDDDGRRGHAGDRRVVGDVGGLGHVDARGLDHLAREPGGARSAPAALQGMAKARGPLGPEGHLRGLDPGEPEGGASGRRLAASRRPGDGPPLAAAIVSQAAALLGSRASYGTICTVGGRPHAGVTM